MLRRLGIRAKVLAVLAVPMLVLVLLGVYITVSAFDDLEEARATQSVTDTLRAYQPLGQAIDNEYVVSMTSGDPEVIAAAQAATDQALAEVRQKTKDLPLDRFPDALVQQFQSVQADYETTLPAARLAVERGGVSSVVRANFQTIENGQLELVAQLGEVFPNRDVAASVTAYRQLSQTSTDLVAELIQGSSLLGGVISPALGAVYQEKVDAVESARTQSAVALNRMSGLELKLPSGQPSSAFIAQRALLASGDQDAVAQVDPAAYVGEIETQTTQLVELAGTAIDHARSLADADVDAALQRFYLTIAATILAAGLSFLLALVVSRSIVNPLRRLTSAASDVRERLPRIVEQVATPGEQPDVQLDPIPVNSRDEVGRLAQAFNSMNATTVRVAQEQAALRGSIAEMFVNVARRDQVLLNRQLSFIDSLERTEEDPNTLANLFRLDHLATRMRRNAESLLVLAGIDSGRRLRDAMPLSDVIRTASSEIEQYDRVELDLQVDPHMLGFNALPAAHMLAELLENATVFSEPETPVTVTTGVSGQFVAVRIRDHGLGMTDEEIEAANAKILSSAAGDALGAQRLGLFVVGRIAQKLGAAVRLSKADGGTGTDTTVLLPASLFATTETSSYGAPASVEATMAQDAAVAPEVAPVDLAALTDGETSLGLPRRRRGDGSEPTADSAPIPVPQLSPSGLPTRGGGELPARPRKTFDENAIVLPETAVPTLSPDLSAAAPDWAPAVQQATSGSGLPSRAARASATPPPPAAPAPAAEPAAPKEDTPSIPSPAARAGLFSGFRTRNAIVEGGDGGVSDQVRAPWMSLGAHGLQPQQPAAPEVPALAADDDEPWTPESAQPVTEVPGLVPDDESAPEPAAEAAPAPVEQPWAPTFASDETQAFEPVTAEPVEAEQYAPAASDDQAYQPASYEPTPFGSSVEAPAEPSSFEPASSEPAQHEPAQYEPAQYEPAQYEPASFAADQAEVDEPEAAAPPSYEPASYEPASYEPSFEQTSYEPVGYEASEPEAVEPAAYEPLSYEQPSHEQPSHEQEQVEEQAAPASYEPASYEPASYEPVSHEQPSYEQPSHEPAAYEPASYEPAAYEPASYEQASHELASRDEQEPAPAAYEPEQPAAEAWSAPAPVEPAPVEPASEAPRVSFTSYSGYAGWSGARRRAAADAEKFDFERTLDEARAWHTGAQPVVADAAPAAEQAPVAEPAYAEPVVEPVYAEPVVEPAAEQLAEPAADEPAWQPAWQAPSWEAVTGAVPVVEEPAAQAVPSLEPTEPASSFAVPSLVADEAEPQAEGEQVWAETTPAWGAPAWPSLAESEAPAEAPVAHAEQGYAPAPVEQPFAQQPAPVEPVAPVAPVAPQPVAEQPAAHAWGAPTGFGAQGVSELERQPAEEKGSRKRWAGLFGRRKGEAGPAESAPASVPTPTPAPAPAPAAGWSAPASVPPESPVRTEAPAWSAPEPPAPAAPAPVAAAPASSGTWAPPEWAASRPAAAAAPAVDVPHPAVPPSVAPRIGTLDDNVAAMLALRSDIQEQALSELSQLSAYRPSVNRSGEQLTKRVPTAVPATAPEPTEPAAPVQRDANELRNRLSSFQSGTSRGRQAAGSGESPRSTS
ncbi:ATP-binding protein [Cellulomonas palmilytica]|uniref:ATP-binding protein n=1 Tax=Cellulomonas palmilytica TaxID=2608402 RepID=UPI001F303D06|nr:ATP-binding protein [Cellulomonas palmilytica]UJP40779.1 HAMP domain-containing protein [Cellulomonas palmilytica]